MKSWLIIIYVVILCVQCCVVNGEEEEEYKTHENVAQFAKDISERTKGLTENARDFFLVNEKAIIEAFNKVSERENRRENFFSLSKKASNPQKEEKPHGFWYSFASSLQSISLIKEYLTPRPTREQLKAKIEEEAELDAIRTARVMKLNKQAREQARLRIQSKTHKNTGKSAISRDEPESMCNLGRAEKTASLINSCSTVRQCLPWKFNSSEVTLDTPAIDLLNNTNIEVTEMRCSSIPVSFLEDYNATNCYVRAIGCNESTPIGECPVEILCEQPSFLAFGIDDGRYAFGGVTDVIYCDGVAVDDPMEYADKDLPAGCEVRRFPSATNGTCYSINTTDMVQVNQFSCVFQCPKMINETQCICPADFTGVNCETQQNITCKAFLDSPLPNCFTKGDEDLLIFDKPCLFSSKLKDKRIEMRWNISCKFASVELRNNNRNDGFTYWVDTPDLKLSSEQDWAVSLEAFQFSSFVYPISVQSSTKMTRENIAGKELMTLSITPSKEYVVGGRVYVELGFEGNKTPHGYSGGVIRRFFLDETDGGFNGGSGKTVTITDGLSPGEVAIIIVATVVGVVIIAAIVRHFYERWKEAKIQDEEAGENKNKKKKSKKD